MDLTKGIGGRLARVFPGAAARYLAKRSALAHAQRLYNAASANQYHPRQGDSRSGNAVMEHARGKLRNWARYQEENHDLAVGVLDDLTDRVIGTGIIVQPGVKDRAGNLIPDLNNAISRAWRDWGRAPEVSGVIPWGELERLLFRTLVRDGETLVKHIEGASSYDYASPVPYVIDSLEPDHLPFDLIMDHPAITHGIERDTWGKIIFYHLLTVHPGDTLATLSPSALILKTEPIPADRVTHLRLSRRIGQLRGVSVFHASLWRFQDLMDYEESERLAAKIAASFTAAITKSADMPGVLTRNTTDSGERNLEMQPAMIFDDLLPGESVETIASNRPSNQLQGYRESMLKAVSAGTGARYSTIARTWDSSYTAMRQESVAHKPSTLRMQEYFVGKCTRIVYEKWLVMAQLSGTLDLSRADPMTIRDADFRGPGEESIDPLDETRADILRMKSRLESRASIQRRRGIDSQRADDEIMADDLLADVDAQNNTETENEPEAETA